MRRGINFDGWGINVKGFGGYSIWIVGIFEPTRQGAIQKLRQNFQAAGIKAPSLASGFATHGIFSYQVSRMKIAAVDHAHKGEAK